MLRIHLENGKTEKVNLADPDEMEHWIQKVRIAKYQASISGLTILHRGVSYSLTRPLGFRDSFLFAEHVPAAGRVKGGERLIVFLDDVSLSIMVHREQRAVRVSISKVGKRRFNPLL